MKQAINIVAIREDIELLLGKDKGGHGIDHVDRVVRLAGAFADKEGADRQTVLLAALLHDVDDYKIFGEDAASDLSNAQVILEKYSIGADVTEKVLDIIRNIGYNKYLDGIRPSTLEGMIVSDADMCDAIGAVGILRTHAYALSKGNEFFDKTLDPEVATTNSSQYKAVKKSHSVQHFFDKLLKIPSILMTDAGRKEGEQRQAIMVRFLDELFDEEDASVWKARLRSL